MTLIEISRKLANDSGLEPAKADAIMQAVVEYVNTVAPVTRDHFDDRLSVLGADLRSEMSGLRADLRTEMSDLRADVQKTLRVQTVTVVTSFILVFLVATLVQHYWH